MTAAISPRWSVFHLADVADLALGKMLDRAKRTAGRPLPYLRNINVRWGHFELSDLRQMPFEEHELERYELRKGDVLICEGGEPGRAAVWQGSADLILFQKALHRVRCSSALEPQWLVYQLAHDAEQGILSQHFTGTTIKHFTGSALRKYPVALPPLAEQRRIVAKLDDLRARSRGAKDALDVIPALLDQFRQSVLAAALRGDLTRDWRAANPDVEPASKLLERIRSERRRNWEAGVLKRTAGRGAKRFEEPKELVLDGLPTLPKTWCWATVRELLNAPLCNGLSVSGSDAPPGTPSLKLSAMGGAELDYSQRRYLPVSWADVEDLEIIPGDFFVARGNGSLALVGRGTAANAPPRGVIFPDTMIRLRFSAELRSTSWVPLIWAARAVRRQIEQRVKTTAGIWKISQSQIESIVVPLPPVEEQYEVVRVVDAMFRSSDQMSESVSKSRERTLQLERSLLERAFRGELVPQGPDDEPMFELLNRIRAEQGMAFSKATTPRGTKLARRASKKVA